VTTDLPRLFQAVQVVADPVRGGDPQRGPDLADRGRVAALAERARDEVEHRDLTVSSRRQVRGAALAYRARGLGSSGLVHDVKKDTAHLCSCQGVEAREHQIPSIRLRYSEFPAHTSGPMKVERFTPGNVPKPIGPYNHVAKAGSFISISATAGVDPSTGELAGPDAYAQTRQILRS